MNFIKQKKGNVWVGLLVLLVFLISIALALMSQTLNALISSKRQAKVMIAQALCDAGVEKAFWKLNKTTGLYGGENDLVLPTGTIDISVMGTTTEKEVIVTAYVPSKNDPSKVIRKVKAKLAAENNTSNASFYYGVQVGSLGVTMSNNAKILGNVYSDGIITGGNGSEITGDAFSAGPLGTITGGGSGQKITVGGNAHAHNIKYTNVTKDAFYMVLANSSVAGTLHPDSQDPESVGLPLAQSTIDQWESWAAAGGTINGSVTITGSQNLGPKKIDGDLTIDTGLGNTLTLTGAVWVTGNITVINNSTVKLGASYGASSGMIIADSPTDKASDGRIVVNNNVMVQGSGQPSSYIMFLSTNTSSDITNPAILAGNNSDAVVYYSTTGMIEVSQNAIMRAITGGGLHLSNGAQIKYDIGLANSNFSGGPGGSWQIKEWQVCKITGSLSECNL